MKIVFFNILLIVSIVTLIGACKKEDDSSSTTTAAACTSTAGGSFTLGSSTVSGKYNMYDGNTSTPECIDNSSSAFSSLFGSVMYGNEGNTASIQYEILITSNTSYEKIWRMYSDTTCSTLEGYIIMGYDNVTIGSAITASNTANDMPAEAYPVTMNWQCLGGYGATDNITAYYNSLTDTYHPSSGGFTTGTAKNWDLSAEDNASDRTTINHLLLGVSTGSTKNLVYEGETTEGAYTNWDTNDANHFVDL